MTLSTGYEKLVKELHEALLKCDGVEHVAVMHDVKIKGKSGASHQIDMYWEFQLAGVTYKTCIECKHYNSKVKKAHVAAFATTLDDIGNATGIFATTHGFQAGAQILAKERDIRLILVNHLLKTVCIRSTIRIPETCITRVEHDEEQARACLRQRGLEHYSHELDWHPNTCFYDSEGTPQLMLHELMKDAKKEPGSWVLEPEGLYERTGIGLIRLKSISYEVTVNSLSSEDELVVNDVSKAIMEDVLTNISCYLNDDGSVVQVEHNQALQPTRLTPRG